MSSAESRPRVYEQFRRRADHIDQAQLAELWRSLPPVATEAMVGLWAGGLFDTGHEFNRRPSMPHWFGKDIRGDAEAWPDVMIDDEGELYAAPIRGTLRMIDFRGVPTAALVYDDELVMDHFAWIDPDTRLGVMDRAVDREADSWLYFWLERRPPARVRAAGHGPALCHPAQLTECRKPFSMSAAARMTSGTKALMSSTDFRPTWVDRLTAALIRPLRSRTGAATATSPSSSSWFTKAKPLRRTLSSSRRNAAGSVMVRGSNFRS